MGIDRRFIEETLPVKEISAQAAKEKTIGRGNISTLHTWWARRPLAASRATNYAALISAPADIGQWNAQRQFIIDFSKWENSSNHSMIERARRDILQANGGKPPRVLDPFGGGGAIPLEAARLGCEVYSHDLNPVAVLIQKCTLEYPQKYGRRTEKKEGVGMLSVDSVRNPLVGSVRKWGDWVLEEARKEIGKFYPPDDDGHVPVGYIWARTIPCQNPSCGAEIPLMHQFWLAKTARAKVALLPVVQNGRVEFDMVGSGHGPIPPDFDPAKGTISRAVATCPVCKSVVDDKTVRRLFHELESGLRIVAVVLHAARTKRKKYRLPTEADVRVFRQAEEYLEIKRRKLMEEWGTDPVPDEDAPGTLASNAIGDPYCFTKFGDYFNARQKLALITFVEKVRDAQQRMREQGYEDDYMRAVACYLGILVSRFSNRMSSLAYWLITRESIQPTFVRQAIAMVWDYLEMNPFNESTGGWPMNLSDVSGALESLSILASNPVAPTVTQCSATSLPYDDDFFDAVLTDPPYYDNVNYSVLSGFFYVWLKRTVGWLYPDLFATPLPPQKSEIVADRYRHNGDRDEAKRSFEGLLGKAFREIRRVLKPNGIATIVYAHKSTAGWETLINSLLDSDLVVTGAWPLNTEMRSRLVAQETAALASAIYIVARKMEREPAGFYGGVKEELKDHLDAKLDRLWEEGIGGADFFIAAIGSAIEVFGKYESVMDFEGNTVRADRLLDDVRKIATDYAVRQILHNGFVGEVSDLTRFYVLWRWNYGTAKVGFDEARKLALGCNIDLANEWNRGGCIKKEKEFIRVLGPQERQLDELRDSHELVDVLHGGLLFWEKSQRSEMVQLLQRSGYGKSEAFYRVAQAISETLPNESKEKKLLDGFLAGRERLREEVRKESRQGRLL